MKHTATSPLYQQAPLTAQYVENGYGYVSGDKWTELAADLGSTVSSGLPGNAFALATDASDDDEVGISTTQKIVPGTTSVQPCEFTGRVNLSDTATGLYPDMSLFIGLGSSFAANVITDAHAIPTDRYLTGLAMVGGETRPRFISINSATVYENKILNFVPVLATAWSYRLVFNVVATSDVRCTVEIDPTGGQDFRPVKAFENPSVHPPYFQSVNIYSGFPAAGLAYGFYLKNNGAADHTFQIGYTAWAMRRA